MKFNEHHFEETLSPEHPQPVIPPHRPPTPPHMRHTEQLSFSAKDWAVFRDAFGDDDSAVTAAGILLNAPPEIQVLALQIVKMIEEVS